MALTAPSEILVSVVVPFHNTSDYLAECIESVLAQTHAKFELLLVDNCSTDGSGEIAAHYVARDSRIRFMATERLLPQVENYNNALRHITPDSTYCKIVQADDWIYPNCLEEMIAAAQAAPNVALVGSYSLYEPMPGLSDTTYVGNTGLEHTCRLLPGTEAARRYLVDYIPMFGSPTCVMYRTSDILAKTDFYNLDSHNEDIESCLDVLRAGDFAFVHQVLSFNRRQSGSIFLHHTKNDGRLLDRAMILHKYAPLFLSSREAADVIDGARRAHYRALGHAVLSFKPRQYWDLHKNGLERIGEPLDYAKLAYYTVRALFDVAGNPKMAIGNWLRRHANRTTLPARAQRPRP